MKINRLAKIASVFTEEGMGYLTTYASAKAVAGDSIGGADAVHDSASPDREKAKRLKRIFERLGPTFVKFGQMLANRVDLFSDEFIAELSSLHAQVTPFDSAIAMRLIETELGRPVAEAFATISTQPVASASIAQVYRATLKNGGAEVAIKVQRPDLNTSLLEDLDLIVQMSGWLDALIPAYKKTMMHVVAKEYTSRSKMELDFLSEANAMQEFGETYGADAYFVFPKVFMEMCSDKIIVMEWMNGPRLGQIRDAAHLESLGFNASEMVRNFLRLQLSMAYEHGLIHADMHPGNIIVREDGRLAVIDCGLNSRVPKKTRELVLKMLLLQSQGRTEEQIDIALQLSPPGDSRDLPKFRKDLLDHYAVPMKKSASSVSKDIIATMRIGTKYRNYANPFLLMIVRNFLILEGIFLKFEPSFDPHEHVGEFVKSILMRRFTPEAMFNTFSPVFGELAIALHNRPALLSRILRLEAKLIDSPNLGDFLKSEGIIEPKREPLPIWVVVFVAIVAGFAGAFLLSLRP